MKRAAPLASVLASLALTLAGCGNTASSAVAAITAAPVPASEIVPRPIGAVINVSITNTSVWTDTRTTTVKVNEPVTLFINAVAPGELHVHSTPEQHIEYPRGGSRVALKFDLPGTVVIEDHAFDQQITAIQVH